jgi:hypothetical protein
MKRLGLGDLGAGWRMDASEKIEGLADFPIRVPKTAPNLPHLDMYRLFWGNEGICDLFTEARSAEVNKHISPRCLKITYLFLTLRGRVNDLE